MIRPRKHIKSFLGGFMEFLKKYSVIGLAIAIVAGEAVNDLVKSVVGGLSRQPFNLLYQLKNSKLFPLLLMRLHLRLETLSMR